MVYLLNKAEGGGASSQYPSVYLLNSHLLWRHLWVARVMNKSFAASSEPLPLMLNPFSGSRRVGPG